MWNSCTNAVPNSCAWEQQGGFTTRRQVKESRKDEIQKETKWAYLPNGVATNEEIKI